MRACPILETARLRLRPHRIDDLPAMVDLWQEPAVVAHTIGKPASEQETWSRLLRYAGMWPILGYGYWAIEEKSSGRFIGELGAADFKREMKPSISGRPEFGWALATSAHGRGYATEALACAVAWARLDLRAVAPTAVCIINPENLASIRVAEKCGFTLDQPSSLNGRRILLYRIRLEDRPSAP